LGSVGGVAWEMVALEPTITKLIPMLPIGKLPIGLLPIVF
jgi:hypothetical protein